MVRATTPTFTLTVPDFVDLTAAARVIFSFAQGDYQIDKEGNDLRIDGNTVYIYLTQQETLQLKVGPALAQLNWSYANGQRMCSNIMRLNITDNLFNEVM